MPRPLHLLIPLLLSASLACADDPSVDPSGDTDAGSDAGSTTRDAGGGEEDASSPPADAGAPAADAGEDAGEDAGAPGCALDAPFDLGATYTDEVRVAPGEDLARALREATPGTRITLTAGTHPGGLYAQGVQGTPEAPIALVGEPGAVIEGGSNNLQLVDPAYLVIEGVTFRSASQNGLNIDDGGDYATPANHVILRGITVEGVGSGGNQDCVKLSGLDDFLIVGSTVRDCSGQGIDMVGCHDGVITGNTLQDTPGAGVQGKGGTADVLIHANTFTRVAGRGVNAGGSTGLEFFRPIDAPHEGARIDVVGNVFVDVGASSGAPIAFVGCDACTFVNNTVVNPLTWVARILQETTGERFVPSRDGVIANNVIVFDSGVLRTFINVGGGTAPENFTIRNNLWWDTSDPGFGGPSWSGPPAEVDGAVADPALAADYSIGASSPAAGAGATAPDLPDHDGACFADPPSIGAHEVNPR
jgi:hypothetical protein